MGALAALWAVPCTVVVTSLMVSHWVPLPKPDRSDPSLTAGLAEVAPPDHAAWTVAHVLYAQCRCSQRTFEYLFERGPSAGAREVVVLVGRHDEYERRATDAGYAVRRITRRELKERLNLESAPLLVISDPTGAVRYVGGYTSRKQGLDYQDLALLEELRKGHGARDLPAYGCGVSRELQAFLDPIGVKYRERDPDSLE